MEQIESKDEYIMVTAPARVIDVEFKPVNLVCPIDPAEANMCDSCQ